LSGLSIPSARDVVSRHQIWFPRTLGTSQGWVFLGDGDELGDLSTPPLTPIRSGLIAQQLLRHGESLRRSQLTPKTSVRSCGGGEGERRLCTPGRDVGGLEIFLLGLDVLATDDGLGISSNSVAAVKTLEPCIGVSHGEADLGEHTIAPYLARQMSVDFVSQEHRVPQEGPKDSNAGGCTREI
jgi:hypothetical protein